MNRYTEALTEFQKAYNSHVGVTVDDNPTEFLEVLKLRHNLIEEELNEFYKAVFDTYCAHMDYDDAAKKKAMVEMIDGITDLLYVVVGTAVAFGIPIDTAFERVHASNLSKLGEDGKPIYRKDGKILKGPNFFPPKLTDLVTKKGGRLQFVTNE